MSSLNHLFAVNDDGNKKTDASLNSKAILNSSFYTSQSRQFLLSDTTDYFIVLKNNKSCIDCFSGINDFVHVIKDSLHATFIVVSTTDSTTLDRKRNYTATKNLMPDFDEFLFQYNGSIQNNIFEILHTEHTPELLIIHQGKIIRIPYDGIFDYPSMNISIDTQRTIFESLK